MAQPKDPQDYEWVAILGWGDRKMGGIGDSQEEAAVALVQQVLSSTEAMFSQAVDYGVVQPAVLARVRALVGTWTKELQALHGRVVSESEIPRLWKAISGKRDSEQDNVEIDEDALL